MGRKENDDDVNDTPHKGPQKFNEITTADSIRLLQLLQKEAVTLQEMQREDNELSVIIDALINSPPDDTKLKNYIMREDILCHIAKPIGRLQTPTLQICIPKQLIPGVLTLFHEGDSHFGIDKTYNKIRERYHFENMYYHVVSHVDSCNTCKARKIHHQRAPLQEMPIATMPWQIVGVDTVGKISPTSWEENKYIIVFVCHFSGWPECFAVKAKSANTVAKLTLEQIIPHHPCPLMLYSDNGTEFINDVISIITSTLNICHLHTSPYHPASNGKVERFNRYLGNSLAKYCKNNFRDWVQYLSDIL